MSYATDLNETITVMRKRTISLAWLAALTGLLALTSCDSATSAGMGTVRLHLAASGTSTMVSAATLVDFGDVISATVTISAAELMPGHVSIPIDPTQATFELIGPTADLPEGVTALLGAAPTLGEYEQLRLFLSSATITVDVNGTPQTFQFDEDSLVPSGQQTGIKVNFGGPIEVGPNATVDLVAVFDVNESFVFQGPPDAPRGVSFKPVIHASTIALASIGGSVTVSPPPVAGVPIPVTVRALSGVDEVASVTVNLTSDAPSADYLLRFLEPGLSYTVEASTSAAGYTITPDGSVTVAAVAGPNVGPDFTLSQ